MADRLNWRKWTQSLSPGVHVLRTVVVVLGAMTILLSIFIGAWLATPSISYLTPISLEYDPGTNQFTFIREVHSEHAVYADWRMQAYAKGGGLQCTARDEMTAYEPTISIVTYPAPVELSACLQDPDFNMVVSWEVKLFGFIPLRPTFLRVPAEAKRTQ